MKAIKISVVIFKKNYTFSFHPNENSLQCTLKWDGYNILFNHNITSFIYLFIYFCFLKDIFFSQHNIF